MSEEQKDAQTSDVALTDEQLIEAQREELLAAVAAGKLDTLQERVAWILNHYPKSRDSDIALQIHFWEEFEPELGGGGEVQKSDLYRLTRLTSLTRARAKIQNTYKMFQATPAVRQARGTLAEEEKSKAAEQQIETPVFDVYADESGKTAKQLIVGSVWCLHPPELLTFIKDVVAWREARRFFDEFHFKTINDSNLRHYMDFVEFLAARNHVFSFKAITVDRAGVKSVDAALQQLFFHLLIRGVEHEHQTGRAPLPRTLQLWKDLEEPGRDKLFMAELRERVLAAGASRFGGSLLAEEFVATDSKGKLLIQVADLYTSSINRVLNAEGKRTGSKDVFADHFLGVLGLPAGPQQTDAIGDMTTLISL